MSQQEVKFKDEKEFKEYLLKGYLDRFLKDNSLSIDEVTLVEHKTKENDGEKTFFYYMKRTDK